MNLYILMPFLYFPEDKTEYIPAVISLIIFMTLACVAMYIFYKKSKKDEKEFNKKYSEQLQQVAKNNNEK
ncbi:hypothetical protein NSA56_03770 [Oceanobacillus caeni]|uniref:Uncharacterized protein n=1 Tax=Oceanobacillus caeni TaxID=405946 RepID=A0ABR5MN96_9BACI|nr:MULTISPECIES: hypothetical protein [Bacillaceae]KKE79529.1 hypothetical protein WH51_05390 [Bacilli bacterium VT-13-104]PZD89762.1 hypothetical protein DEJ64_01650 [Bacilli bacterium]KPH78686.1 hypothetical protein AFL42_00820 [Oceanobacillus caeni]MBU8791827.1 hypothetical protein [Oceanobacillus caeni]MCR1833513.1 hypothetical protein [Oceanobacillus caeni]